MKLHQFILVLFTLVASIHALALPSSLDQLSESSRQLFKRKGGGGGGGKGSGGGSSSGTKGGSGSSSSSSSSSGRGSSTSNTGGRTTSGSGTAASYGGGRYYAGGAAVPYTSGARSPGGVAPYFIGGAALGFMPGLALYGAYYYAYPHYYTYHNNTDNQNETMPVSCFCGRYSTCGCDNNTDASYLDSVANNASVARVADINGTSTLTLNGTLDNGTTAAGGTDSAAASLRHGLGETGGWWLIVAGVVYTVWFM